MRAADPERLDEAATLSRLFALFEGAPRAVLAVSGGSDSLALLLLAERWRRLRGGVPELLVVCVDHGLRPEAATETAEVGRIAAGLGLPFRALKWEGPHPASDIEAAAREARYALLFKAAREAGATIVATAHHREDQAETFLMRLARGSGVYGLAGMASSTERDGIRLVRPLLELGRADLAAVVAEAGLVPVDDPHNADRRFARARIRALMPELAREGLDAPTLAATAARLRRTASAIDHYAGHLLAEGARADDLGAVRLDVGRFGAEPEETRLRALARILRAVGGAPYVPRLESLVALEAAMGAFQPGSRLRRTLGGVLIERREGEFRFQREAGREGLPERIVERRFEGVWDGRFRMRIDAHGETVTLGPLGGEGRRALAICLPDGLPRAMEAVPAIRRGNAILAVPSLGVMPRTEAEIEVRAIPIVGERLAESIPNEGG